VPAVLLLLAGCAAGRGSTSEALRNARTVEIVVRNNVKPPTLVTVRIFSLAGTTSLLGSVPSGQTRSFGFEESLFERSYRLEAEPGVGQLVRSQGFQLFEGARVVWSLNTNVVDLGYR
jgi:hypothetical protein